MPETKADLIAREKMLEDVADSLDQERKFAISVQDWPRKTECERRLKVARDRLLSIHLKLAVAA